MTVKPTPRSSSTVSCVSAGANSVPGGVAPDQFGRAYREAAGDPPLADHLLLRRQVLPPKGVAAAALKGALSEIARLGGGTVESSPEDAEGRKVSNSFLYNATVSMFEQQGFARTRQLGKNDWLVTKRVRPKRTSG